MISTRVLANNVVVVVRNLLTIKRFHQHRIAIGIVKSETDIGPVTFE